MRISDWSSDLCSSDLVLGAVAAVGRRPALCAVGAGSLPALACELVAHGPRCLLLLQVLESRLRAGLLPHHSGPGALAGSRRGEVFRLLSRRISDRRRVTPAPPLPDRKSPRLNSSH